LSNNVSAKFPDASPPQSALLLTQAHLAGLPSALQRVGKYVLENPDLVIRETISQLGTVTDTGTATIIRFCRVLGFSGLREFKLALAADLATQRASEPAAPGSATQRFCRRLGENIIQATRETQSVLDDGEIDRLAEAMASARRIDIFGAGTTGFIGQYLAFRLLRIGLPAHATVDPTYAAYVSTGLDRRSVVIAISESGMTRDTVNALKRAKSIGTVTAVITNRKDGPIIRYADHVLLTFGVRSPLTGSKLTVAYTHLMAIETLVAALTLRLGLLDMQDEEEE
jgi:DNA-binding MurR/RpiR family transcriptional regulator